MSRVKDFDTIRSQREFDLIYKRADKVWHTPLFVLFFKESEERKVAFVASKKVGNAVGRNRAKRLLRALFVKYNTISCRGSYIFVAKPAILQAEWREMDKSFRYAMRRSSPDSRQAERHRQ